MRDQIGCVLKLKYKIKYPLHHLTFQSVRSRVGVYTKSQTYSTALSLNDEILLMDLKEQ